MVTSNPKVTIPEIIEDASEFKCRNCNKSYKHKQGRWRHEQNCNEKINIPKQIYNKLKKEIENDLLKKLKVHPKTIQKINNQLNNSNNTTNIQNNIIIPTSQQNLGEVLKDAEKLLVLNSGNNAHLKLTDILYKKEEYKQFRNVYITNLSNDIGYIYDKKENKFIVKTKKAILEDYGIERFSDIEEFYEELGHKIDESKLDKLKSMVYDYFNDDKFKELKNKELLISLYNNKLNVKQLYQTVNEKEIEL